MKRVIGKILLGAVAILSIGAVFATIMPSQLPSEQKSLAEPLPICDGINITQNCQDDSGTAYKTYLQHEAVAETTKQVTHPATPAVTRTVYHPAVTGTRQVRGDCIRTSISYKNGTCALSQCRDGSYSGSTGRGTCSYHGGVARSGGPWYHYTTETYVITPA